MLLRYRLLRSTGCLVSARNQLGAGWLTDVSACWRRVGGERTMAAGRRAVTVTRVQQSLPPMLFCEPIQWFPYDIRIFIRGGRLISTTFSRLEFATQAFHVLGRIGSKGGADGCSSFQMFHGRDPCVYSFPHITV